jgi:hypothetical protein
LDQRLHGHALWLTIFFDGYSLMRFCVDDRALPPPLLMHATHNSVIAIAITHAAAV